MPDVFGKKYTKPNIRLPVYLNSDEKWNDCIHYCKNLKKFEKYLNQFYFDIYVTEEILEEITFALLKDMIDLFGKTRNMEDCTELARLMCQELHI